MRGIALDEADRAVRYAFALLGLGIGGYMVGSLADTRADLVLGIIAMTVLYLSGLTIGRQSR